MCEILNALREPWSKEEVKFRVGSTTKDKTKALPLAYVDARAVMERLDRVLGAANWQDKYEFHDKRTICHLSLRIDGEWITKCDGAGDSDVESEKGSISDAFKRAAVKWGMGRELYEMKCKWMPYDDKTKQLVGDPWQFLIKNNKPQPKKELQEDPIKKATNFVIQLENKLRLCKTKDEIMNVQQKNNAGIGKIMAFPELFDRLNKFTITELGRVSA